MSKRKVKTNYRNKKMNGNLKTLKFVLHEPENMRTF